MSKKNTNIMIVLLVLATTAVLVKDHYFPTNERKIHRLVELLQKKEGEGVTYLSHFYSEGSDFTTEITLPDQSHFAISVSNDPMTAQVFVYIRSKDASWPWFTVYNGKLYFASENESSGDAYNLEDFEAHKEEWIRRYDQTLSRLYKFLIQ